jgi:glycosyltransferase involved in cell wall biosynthesis
MKKAGYEVNHIKFAPDYIEEICKHDIQLTPIAIGTGTKGKVLDALANGLLVIGTPYALENIAVEHGVSCIEYRQPQEVTDVLLDIPNNLQKYERMAEEGRRQVLQVHNRAALASQLFG